MKRPRAGKKDAIIILNGISLKKKVFYHDYLPFLSEIFNVEVHETLSRNDAVALASKFTDRYVDLILVAGGDGTLNQVVNGMLKGRETANKLPVIGIIPIGSANDFVQSAGLSTNTAETLERIAAFKTRKIDVGQVDFTPEPGSANQGTSYFINVADLGMGPEVMARFANSGRPFGSEIAYYKSILKTFFSYKPMVVNAEADDWSWEGKTRSIAIGNGKYLGHGLCIAPDAILDDKLFSVFICGAVSVMDFVRHKGKMKKGKHVNMKDVFYKNTRSLDLTSDAPCAIEGDGELFGWLPAKVKFLEKQIDLLI